MYVKLIKFFKTSLEWIPCVIAATPLSCTGDPGILAGLCEGDANLCNCWYSCWRAWIPGPGAPDPSDARRTGEYLSVTTWLLGSLYESLLFTKIKIRTLEIYSDIT